MIIEKIKYAALLIGLFLVAKVDWQKKKIPNHYLKELLLWRGMLFIIEETVFLQQFCVLDFQPMVMGFLCGGGILLTCYVVTKRRIGAGDVKLFAVIGLYVGAESVLRIIAFSSMIAFDFCVIKLLLKKMDINSQISFGPFVFWGTIMEIVFCLK